MMLLAAAALHAQSVDMAHADRVTDLSQARWRFHNGDDPRWAAPDFDDSGWSLLVGNKRWVEQGYAGYAGVAWYRIALRNVQPGEPVAMSFGAEGPWQTSYELFCGGESRFHAQSDVGPQGWLVRCTPKSSTLSVAVRVVASPWADFNPGGLMQPFLAGSPWAVQQMSELRLNSLPLQAGATLFVTVAQWIVGFFMLVLYSRQKASREYLWFGLFLLATNISHDAIISWLFPKAFLDSHVVDAVTEILVSCNGIALVLFVYSFIHRRADIWLRIAIAINAIASLILFPQFLLIPRLMDPTASNLLWFTGPIFSSALLMLILIRNRAAAESRTLIVPMVLQFLTSTSSGFFWIADTIGLHISSDSPPLITTPIYVYPADIANLSFLVIMGWILLRRFVLTADIRAQQQADLDAAQQVQAVLLEAGDFHPWLVDTAYLPAREVGGDLFLCLPGEKGALLVVVGDVSGKGLDAAMLVATIIGALRNEDSRQPATVLTRLNRMLIGKKRGGFVTCCAALFGEDGNVTIANAGHIPPYAGGDALEVESSLPLGIIDQAEYSETNIPSQGRVLTFLSDGVLEATNARGEMLGFERLPSLTGKMAEEIAEAARDWGQNDDISVVKVGRAAP